MPHESGVTVWVGEGVDVVTPVARSVGVGVEVAVAVGEAVGVVVEVGVNGAPQPDVSKRQDPSHSKGPGPKPRLWQELPTRLTPSQSSTPR